MTQPTKSRSYIVGLSIGTFWLIAASTGFTILMLALAATAMATIAIAVVAAAALVLLAVSLYQIIAAIKLPRESQTLERAGIGRLFGLTVVLEVVTIVIVNVVSFLTGHMSLLVPLDLIVIGIHFLPLAKLFDVPRYTLLGVLFCVSAVIAILALPADAHAGAAVARFLYSTLGAAAAAWGISIASIVELRRLLARRFKSGTR